MAFEALEALVALVALVVFYKILLAVGQVAGLAAEATPQYPPH